VEVGRFAEGLPNGCSVASANHSSGIGAPVSRERAKFRSRSHRAVIRVYEEAGNVIETHEQVGHFKEP
jgi:hypothetical protein